MHLGLAGQAHERQERDPRARHGVCTEQSTVEPSNGAISGLRIE